MNKKQFLGAIRPHLQALFLFPFFKHFATAIEIKGLDNLTNLRGPVVYVSNHASHADTAAILYALPKSIRENLCIAAAADYFYTNKIVGSIVTILMNTFPFEREHPRKALVKAKEILRDGHSLLIYPEGTRAHAGEAELHFKRGFASLSCQMALPVVPIYLEGSREMLPKGAAWPRKAKIRVVFGEPIVPTGYNSNEVAHMAEQRVQNLAKAA